MLGLSPAVITPLVQGEAAQSSGQLSRPERSGVSGRTSCSFFSQEMFAEAWCPALEGLEGGSCLQGPYNLVRKTR